jgi:predicted SAM-dependent methyltransferase
MENIKSLELLRAERLIIPARSIWNRIRVRKFISALLRNRRIQLVKRELKSKRYLNVGCGNNLLSDFINLDYMWTKNLDLCWDIRKGLPLRSNSLSGIFTEHALEHFEWRDIAQTVIPELFRVLKPGGVIRICVPDAEMAIDAYTQARRDGLVSKPFRNRDPHALTPLMNVTNTFRRLFESYESGHKFAWDYQTMEFFLDRAGFVEIERVSYMNGRNKDLLVDYQKRAKESLYVEAVKAGA